MGISDVQGQPSKGSDEAVQTSKGKYRDEILTNFTFSKVRIELSQHDGYDTTPERVISVFESTP